MTMQRPYPDRHSFEGAFRHQPLRWENAHRWYEVELICDLFGDWVVKRYWGASTEKDMGSKPRPCWMKKQATFLSSNSINKESPATRPIGEYIGEQCEAQTALASRGD